MKKIIILVFVSVFISAIFAQQEQGSRQENFGHFTIHYYPEDQKSVSKTAQILNEAYGELSAYFNFHPVDEIEVYLVSSTDHFKSYFGQSYHDKFQGVAFLEHNMIVIKTPSLLPLGSIDYEKVIAHELCHLFLSDFAGADTIPRWLHEGIAMYLEPIWYWGGFRQIVLPRAYLADRLIPLCALCDSFPPDENLMQTAYVQSRDFTAYLMNRYGKKKLLLLLKRLKDTGDVNGSLILTYGEGLDGLEADWKLELKKRYNWIYLFVQSRFFWFVMSVVAAFGYLLIRIRRKRAFSELPDEECESLPDDTDDNEPADQSGSGNQNKKGIL